MKRMYKHILIGFLILGSQFLSAQDGATQKSIKLEATFIEATKQYNLGNFENAAFLYSKISKADKTNAAAFYQLAKANYEMKKIPQAIKAARKAVVADPSNIWYASLLGELLVDYGDYKNATKVYEDIIKRDIATPDSYISLAYVYAQQNKLEKAISVYDQLEKKTGVDEEITQIKFSMYDDLGKENKAAEELIKLIGSNPGNAQYYHWLGEYYIEKGKLDKAEELYTELKNIYPNDALANLFFVEKYKADGELLKYFQALNVLFADSAIDIDLKVQELYPFLGEIDNMSDGEKSEFSKLGKTISATHSEEAKAQSLYGDILYLNNDLDDALIQYNKTLDLDQSVISVWEQKMAIQQYTGDVKGLIKTSTEAMDLFPNQASVFFMNGLAHSLNKDSKKAISAYEESLMMSSGNAIMQQQILMQLGTEYNDAEQYIKSDEAFERILKKNPDNFLALNNYSYFLSVREDKLNKAAEMALKANQLSPNNASFQDTYGWVLYKQGKYTEAKGWLEKSLKNGGSESAEVLEHVGDVEFKLGNKMVAVEYWEKAIIAGGDANQLNNKINTSK